MAVSSPDLKAFLVATPFFGGLSDASLDLLISMLVERRFDVGATVVAEGEPGRSMYIVHSGELLVSKLGESGRAIRMTGLGPGDFFGEMTLIEMQNRSATVVADSSTVLYELTARNLYTYYKADIYAYVMVIQISTASSVGGSAVPTIALPSWQMLHDSPLIGKYEAGGSQAIPPEAKVELARRVPCCVAYHEISCDHKIEG
jgi:CRP/FNR family cyclic AMP-dependent transcriptional regulator